MGKTGFLLKFVGNMSKIWMHICHLMLNDNIVTSVSKSSTLS